MFTISSTSSVHHRFVPSAAQVQFYTLFPCMLQLQLFTHTLSLRAATAAVYTHSFPACCNCSCLHTLFPCVLQLQLFTHTLSLRAATAAVYTHSFPACCNCSCLHTLFPCVLQLFTLILSLHAATAAVYTHSFPACSSCLHSFFPCMLQLQQFTHTLFPCVLHILCWLRNPAGCEGSMVNQFLSSVTRHSRQLHFHFRDFSGGVCQVMKTTTAESNPDMTVLLQQTPCFSPKVLATDKMAIMSWLQTTRWQSCPGYRQDGNHV